MRAGHLGRRAALYGTTAAPVPDSALVADAEIGSPVATLGRTAPSARLTQHWRCMQHVGGRAMPAPAAPAVPEQLQFHAGDTGRDIEPLLALDAEGLQRVG